ncbi:ESPR domain-containing protein [Cupriavidus sp. D39]|uniref:ESPR domain-containing protein n=1 Tax=Cupriavidus sp. D39 TaxID=2997877 RepID=UPI002271CC3A|nr:ESPR domain-containing protein [Cupriavidus sp. D39]MCY0858732.1 ESPR domain-containing protein [Cupriavidus sp. D39]
MNTIYRLVFSKARGMLVAVSEHAIGNVKGSGSGSGSGVVCDGLVRILAASFNPLVAGAALLMGNVYLMEVHAGVLPQGAWW